jgi:hypothetical protein
MGYRSEIYHNLIGQREQSILEQAVLDESDSPNGYISAYNFLDDAFNEDGFESWIVEKLSLSGRDREDGVEEGRILFDEDYFLTKNVWRCYDLDNDNLKKGDSKALKNNYEAETGNKDYSGGRSFGELNNFLKVLADAFDENSEAVERKQKKNSANQFEFNIEKDQIRGIYECLDKVFFPGKEQVENELELSINEIKKHNMIDEYLRVFPYANNKHVSSQTGQHLEKLGKKKKEFFESWEGHNLNNKKTD